MDAADRLLSASLVEQMLAVGTTSGHVTPYTPSSLTPGSTNGVGGATIPGMMNGADMAGSTTSTVVHVDAQAEISEEIGKMAQEVVQEAVSNEVFARYKHSEIVAGCRPHPGDIVEAGPLADLPLPPPTYPLTDSLPAELITGGKLSSLQLEGILYACQRHQKILPNGTRAGFFIGDGAGVGKGRQISGLILDNFARGRTKSVWFSISTDLIMDARRDLTDIGCHVKVIEGCQQLDKETRVFGLPGDLKHGVIFSTYATLVSSVQRGQGKHTRLQQLVDWCGGADFSGCLVFDECHKAKNFVPGKEQASTKVALAVATIQRMLPKARVVYCSATGVTDVKNMAFMERLGLWGDGAPFRSFEHFLESVQRKGLGVAEMLAMEMKSSGMYVSRGLSFKDAEFMTVEAALTKEQIKMYDVAAHTWNELRKALETALHRTGSTNNRVWASFWAAHQRFFKQLCMGMKVPTIIQEAKAALDHGQCVVIGLQTTGEASLESELSKPGAIKTGFVSLCREIMSRFIQQHFPTVIEGVTNGPGTDDWSETAKTMLLGFTEKIELPDSPLDEIIDKLGGPDSVAEMTGRRGRMVRRSAKDKPEYELRDSDSGVESLNINERNLFMEGKKLVAIISDAASTGISLHADQRAGNQRRRVHLTIELPWSADKAVQQLGRSHRSNQTSGPLYKLLTTDLGGERRFAAAVARRLQSLGALTKGDRRAATGADLTEFNFDTPYGRGALRAMYHAICYKKLAQGVDFSKVGDEEMDEEEFHEELQEVLVLMGLVDASMLHVSAQVKDKDTGDVSKFLNRILGLRVLHQNKIFNYFTECLDAAIQGARKEGRYNEGMLDIVAASVEMESEPKEVFTRTVRKNHSVTKHVVLKIDRGLSWEAAMTRYENHTSKHDGFYWSRREIRGRRWYVLLTQKEGSTHLVKVARPNTGVSVFDEEKADMLSKYSPISPKEAESGWKQQYEDSKDHCIHGPKCKAGPTCTVGTRIYKISLLCGGVVTLMSMLEATLAKFAAQLNLSKSECHIRVVRVQLSNGERVVGIRYPELLIPEVERALDEQVMLEQYTPRQQQLLLASGILAQHQQLLASSSSSAAASPPSQIAAASTPTVSHTEVQPVAPVNKTLLNRAITPPVTIKNFFKPKTADQNRSKQCNGNDSVNNVLPTCTEATNVVKDGNSVTCVSDELKTLIKNEVKKEDTVTGINKTSKISEKRTEIFSFFGKQQKRPLQSDETPSKTAKKQKQSNLKNSFAKQTSIKEKKQLTCPICKLEFKPGTFNSEINEHIDNCLID